jgi:TolB protein
VYDALWTIGPDGHASQRLTHDGTNGVSPAWSPDGRRIAFTRYVSGRSEIDVVDADGAHEYTVVGGPKEQDTQPAWSPDAKRIAFVREVRGDLRLGVANADGTNVHRLPGEDSPYGVPSWSPDGRELVYSESGIAVMSVAPDGSNKHAVLQLGCGPSLCARIEDAAFSGRVADRVRVLGL